MIRLAISSQKGGVGKTTVAINLAYSLARRGWRVLLMDTDPQGSVGLSLSRSAHGSPGFYDALMGDSPGDLIIQTRLPEFQLLTAGSERDFIRTPVGSDPIARRERAGKVLDELSEGAFDLILIDTPAGTEGITSDLLDHSDYVIIPQQAEPLSVRSLPRMLQSLTTIRKRNPKLKIAGVLPSMVQQKNATSIETLAELNRLLPPSMLTGTAVPRDDIFLEASEHGVPVALLSPNPPAAAMVFDQLASELEHRLQLITDDTPSHEPTRLLD